jgi:hypothetical protein
MKWKLLLITALLAAQLATACIVQYDSGNNITILENIESKGLGSDCNLTVYNETDDVYSDWMARNDLLYTESVGYLPTGEYTAGIECNYTVNSSFSNSYVGECKFEVKEASDMIIAFLAGILILSGIMLYIAFGIEKIHGLLKLLFITMTIFMQIFTGRLIMIAAEGTDYAALSLTLYTTIIWVIRFFVLYLIVYFIYTGFDMMGKVPQKYSLRNK